MGKGSSAIPAPTILSGGGGQDYLQGFGGNVAAYQGQRTRLPEDNLELAAPAPVSQSSKPLANYGGYACSGGEPVTGAALAFLGAVLGRATPLSLLGLRARVAAVTELSGWFICVLPALLALALALFLALLARAGVPRAGAETLVLAFAAAFVDFVLPRSLVLRLAVRVDLAGNDLASTLLGPADFKNGNTKPATAPAINAKPAPIAVPGWS
jgi:chromate transport protein ChrA